MKKCSVLLAAVFAVASLRAATVEQVIVRQQWPWSTDVKIEYMLSGVDASQPVDISIKAFNGETEIDSSRIASAVSGDVYGVTEAVGTIILDPVKAFGTERVAFDRFRVKLSAENSSESSQEVLYRIVDLQTKEVTEVKRGDILNGLYGSFETDFSFVGTTSLTNVLIWTGVTNDVKYMTTHLVLRKIPVANEIHYLGPNESTFDGVTTPAAQRPVKLTKNYWMGVFEVTQDQMNRIYPECKRKSSFSNSDYAATRPAEDIYYYDMRGWSAEANSWSNGADYATARHVDSDSFFGKLRALLDDDRYDLPTEAQWEIACRAGTTNHFYTGANSPETYVSAYVSINFGRYKWNGGRSDGRNTSAPEPDAATVDTTRGTAKVGSYLPNAYGLYDMCGNVGESCLDWNFTHTASETLEIDPMGGVASSSNRIVRGGNWDSYASGLRCGSIGLQNPGAHKKTTGFRICLTEE